MVKISKKIIKKRFIVRKNLYEKLRKIRRKKIKQPGTIENTKKKEVVLNTCCCLNRCLRFFNQN
jgi:hypothetical protein